MCKYHSVFRYSVYIVDERGQGLPQFVQQPHNRNRSGKNNRLPGMRPLRDVLQQLALEKHCRKLEEGGYTAAIDICTADLSDIIDMGFGVSDAQRILDACILEKTSVARSQQPLKSDEQQRSCREDQVPELSIGRPPRRST